MTPARLAEIRAYIARLDLDQLPPWTVEQAIIRDLWEELQSDEPGDHESYAWTVGFDSGIRYERECRRRDSLFVPTPPRPPNPYRADVS